MSAYFISHSRLPRFLLTLISPSGPDVHFLAVRIQCLTHPFARESTRAFKARPPSPGSAPGDAARPSGSRMLTIRTKNTTGDRPVRRRHQARAFPVWGGAQCTERRWRPECAVAGARGGDFLPAQCPRAVLPARSPRVAIGHVNSGRAEPGLFRDTGL